jgi:hypothetical protein
MFHEREGAQAMTTRTYAAQANAMAGFARVLADHACPVSPAPSFWSPIALGTTTDKHGRPRRPEVSRS